ncbi:MAG: hypothetical protein HKO57_10325, partial [Akkermansiaceae bacterium]|nr:hypothetical protein [Akkermansiaceae bacterium]
MSQSPLTLEAASREELTTYEDGWDQLFQRIRHGESLSGRERNCVFINEAGRGAGGVTFADVSHLSGLDFPDDGRGIALTDWDRDGDLDLWLSNRTSPAVRFMRNDHAPGSFRQVVLEGTRCNRDAIGARVEMVPGSGSPAGARRATHRTLRAGDGYLSQSSKTLHFGAAGEAGGTIRVRWPGQDAPEDFPLPDGMTSGRVKLVQGTGKARRLDVPAAPLPEAAPVPGDAAEEDLLRRIVVVGRPLFPP